MSEPLSSSHNQTPNSLQNTSISEEPKMSEIKVDESESHDHHSDDCEDFADSNDPSDSAIELPPQMIEMLISPYVRRHNELKATLIQALQTHHSATNIVRVARKYIYCLYGIIENITGPNPSHNALINLRDEAYEREEELKQWETLFNNTDIAQSLMDSINEPSPGETKSNNLSTISSTIPQTLSRVTELVERNLSKQTNGNSNDNRDETFNMHPVEMLELSMQTSSQDQLEQSEEEYEDEINHSRHSTSESQYGAQVLQGFLHDSDFVNNIQKQQSLRSDSNQNLNGDKRQFFTCEFDSCNYSTHNRQRLIMHQKGHRGTPLFYCDVDGCGYLSNFKGNIKIHKRHKHKEGFDDESSPGKTRGRKRKFDNHLFRESSMQPNQNEQINDATLESSSNDSKKDKDEMNICRFDANTGNYICQWPSCGWITRWKQLVEPHILGHTGMKPYKCDVPGCDYQTNYKGNVKLHKKKHIKERTSNVSQLEEDQGSYKCDINGCDFQTVWKNSFESHQKNHFRSSSIPSSNRPSETTSRYVVITRPGETPRVSIVTKPLIWKDSSAHNIEKKRTPELSTSSSNQLNDDQTFDEKHSLQDDGPSNEYSKMSSSHSNSPEPEDEDEDDEPQYIGQSYIEKPASRSFLLNNSHY